MATDALPSEREVVDPANVLGDMETLNALDVEIAREREREEARLIRLARKAGFFHVRMENEEIDALFRKPLLAEVRRPSTLARLEGRRDAHYAGHRARDARRRKALLDGFVVAQCRHKPDVHASDGPGHQGMAVVAPQREGGGKKRRGPVGLPC